jgi:hypothetical protein
VNKPKGGRGKRAPYETTVVRVPDPVLEQVEAICDAYRNGEVLPEKKPVTDFESIREQVDQWRKTAKVGKDKLQNLLQLIYGVDIAL